MGMWLSGCFDTRLLACGAPGQSMQILVSICDNGVYSGKDVRERDVENPGLILLLISVDVELMSCPARTR
jgi:hypothetical protein